MILVVFAHVMLSIDLVGSSSISGAIFIMFRMPLFFFISGFFAFRIIEKWDSTLFKRVFSQKFKAQIFCTIIFYALLYYSRGENPVGWIYKGFGGYWFTITLFQMFVIYSVSIIISRMLKRDIVAAIMIIVSLSAFLSIKIVDFESSRISRVLGWFTVCYYIQWFTMGLIVRKYATQFVSLVSNNRIKTAIFVLYILCLCFIYSDWVKSSIILNTIFNLSGSYLGLLTIITLFISAKSYFAKENFVSNALCFTGRRTLDIYMLHYFLLPPLPILGQWLAPNSMVLFQLIYGLGTAVIITAICLLLSNCIRSSSILADWLFGVRKQTQLN